MSRWEGGEQRGTIRDSEVGGLLREGKSVLSKVTENERDVGV